MKKRTKLLMLSCLAAVVTLTACNKSSFGYKTYYTLEFETLNYMISQSASDHEFTSNIVDGLLDTNRFGALTPTLAKALPEHNYDSTKDVTTFDFEIRDNVKWYTYEGKEYADVTAKDWVTTGEYILNPNNRSETSYMWTMFIVGAADWENAMAVTNTFASGSEKQTIKEKETTGDDFAKSYGFANYAAAKAIIDKGFDKVVGVHANGQKLSFDVIGNTEYFQTALNYVPFYPSNAQFLKEQGTTFGDDFDKVLYCGAYFMTSHNVESEIILKANDNYYDKDNVDIKSIQYTYVGQNDPSTTRTMFNQGQISGFTLNPRDTAGWESYVTGADGKGTIETPADPNTYTASATSAYVYFSMWNFDRSYNLDTHTSKNWSTHTAATYANTQKAIANADFRKALTYGLDWVEYIKERQGYAFSYSTKGLMPQGLATDIKTNKDYTDFFAAEFKEKAGLTDMTQEQVVKYMYPNSTSDTKDLVYNKDKAKAFAGKAYETLSAAGVTFPVLIETLGSPTAETQAIISEVFANISEGGDNAITTPNGTPIFKFHVYEPASTDWNSLTNTKAYDIFLQMGWGPDYADPLTYLNCWKEDGDMVSYLGFNGSNDALQREILGGYTDILNASGSKEGSARFEGFAEAEYKLIYEDAVIIPYMNPSSTYVYVSKLVPYSTYRGAAGVSNYKYKGKVVADHVINSTEFTALRNAWLTKDDAKLAAEIKKVVNNEYIK